MVQQALEEAFLPVKVRVATGLYVNWDSALKVDEEVLAWAEASSTRPPRGSTLRDEGEAAYLLMEAVRKGGGEHLISEELYRRLKELFSWKIERRLGGNGFHMGKALLELGVRPLVSYPCRPKAIMYSSPTFKVAHKGRFRVPSEAVKPEDPEYDHLSFEFTANPGLGIEETGRLILSWDRMSSEGWFDEEFLEFALNSAHTDLLVFAYAHLLLPNRRERTDFLADELEDRRRPKVHLEFGEGCSESMKYAMERLADGGCVDSWGLNERESVEYLRAASGSLEDLAQAGFNALKAYGLERVCIHTSRFTLACSRLEPEAEFKALTSACKAAAALTMGGSLMDNFRRVERLPRCDVRARAEKAEGLSLVVVPTYWNSSPKVLTGLGDCFSAVQAVVALCR